MEGKTLEDVNQRLNRLEKMVAEVNEKLSWIVEELISDAPKNCSKPTTEPIETLDDSQDVDSGSKAIEKILERMGYPPDFDPGPLEEVRKSMVESGIRPEDNEFSRAIIAEREM